VFNQQERTMAEALRLTKDEARGIALGAQGLFEPPAGAADLHTVRRTVERLGVVQVDTISVVERSQYLVLWSRLGPYDARLLDALIHPHRHAFECWCHVASIVPMCDYRYHRRPRELAASRLWSGDREWMAQRPDILAQTLDAIRERGPLASAEFERAPDDLPPEEPWAWYGKESRRALQILWTLGDLMVHSRRGGQKVYDLRERVLGDVFGGAIPGDDDLPAPEERLRYLALRTVRALGVVTPSWLWDYFRVVTGDVGGSPRTAGARQLDALAREDLLVPVEVEGVADRAYLDVDRLADLERLRDGTAPSHTTLLSPFDSLIWDRARTRALWDYEVAFEAYVVPAKRRYGYYCLAILHRGRIVGRLDPKMERDTGRLLVRTVYLEPGIAPSATLMDDLAAALRDLARFLGADSIEVERGEPERLAAGLRARLRGGVRRARTRQAPPASSPASSRATSRR
jgi:uncharacterized protein